MLQWAHLTAGILSVVILSSLLAVFLRRWCCLRRPENSTALNTSSPIRRDNFQARISKLHQTSLSHQLDISHRESINSTKPGLFIWAEHPALMTEAVEKGWSRFGFAVHAGSDDPGVVITWKMSNGSVDFTQTIKFNQDFREIASFMVLQAALPLPGPQLICSAFPQEAYFEITLVEILGQKLVTRKEGNGEGILSIGLGAGLREARLPGKFPASIGFQSDGAVYLDGMKLVCESKKHEWAKENKVVGCGYDPRKKKVYFTVNSHLAHVINCKADEFGTPLYPILASNTEATVLINLGQFPFYYGPANAQRTPNPCGSAVAGFEDSKDLFSIGRLDSQYLRNFFTNRANGKEIPSGRTVMGNSNRRKLDYDEESDADLFEIALECSGEQNLAKL